MKKLISLLTMIILTTSFAACGDVSEESKNVSTVSDTVSQSTEQDVSSSAANAQSETSTESEKPSLPDNSSSDESSQTDGAAENIDKQITNDIKALLAAMAENDAETFLKISDIEGLKKCYPYETDDLEEDITELFEDVSPALSDFTGNIKVFYFENISDMIEGDALCDTYGMTFAAQCGGDTDVSMTAMIFDNGGKWCYYLSDAGELNKAFYDFESLITQQLRAAAQGDLDEFEKIANEGAYEEAYKSILTAAGNEPTDDFLNEMKEMFLYQCESGCEDLNELLDENYDGSIMYVQSFPEGEVYDGAVVYGRLLINVVAADGTYAEVEGTAFSVGDERGLILMPD